MRELKQYFSSLILLAIAVVLLIIVVLNILSVLVDQVNEAEKSYNFLQIIIYTLWRVPGFIHENIGFSSLIGCLVGLGLLASSNELTVVRTSGVSVLGVVYLVMRPVLLVIILGVGLGEIAPYADRIAEASRAIALQGDASVKYVSEKQVWNREGNEFIRFNTVLPNGKVFGVTRFNFNENKQLVTMQTAKQGTYEGKLWLLEDVQTTYFVKGVRRVEQDASMRWYTRITPSLLTLYATDPENLTLRELRYYSNFLADQALENDSHRLEFWRKLLMPLEIFSLVLVGIAFIFGPLRQTTMGYRVFSGVITGVVFKTIQDISASSSIVFGFEPLLAVLLPITVCAGIGLFVLSRIR